ncbi:hypothetical protein LCGC14_2256170, partial [marine sediment metagenome]
MEFVDVLHKRQSTRKFQNREVSDELIREIVQLAGLAPSAGNLQAFRVVIVRDKITSISAPVSLVICATPEVSASKYGERGRSLYAVQDATIFAAYIQLVITNYGLSSVWIGAFNEGKISRSLHLDEHLRPIAMILLGYS